MLLITGHPRSGTTYMVQAMKEAGFDMPHERIGKDGTVSWMHITERDKFDIIFHVVRDPLKVIPSSGSLMVKSFDKMFEVVGRPTIRPRTMMWQMYTWYHWNLFIEKYARLRFRIEDIDEVWKDILWELGVSKPVNISHLSKRINTRGPYTAVTYNDLEKENKQLAVKIEQTARRYGYNIK